MACREGGREVTAERRWPLLTILALSLVLRAWLVLHGGQYYWPDEQRYTKSQAAVDAVVAGDLREALRALNSADHFLFKVIGVAPAAMARVVAANPKVPALFFSLFSVLNLWLVGRIARRCGALEKEALLATFLAATASTLFYYSRHLLPYDCAMSFGLLAVLAAVRDAPSARDSCRCGLLASACFLAYNGYWALVAFAAVLHVASGPSAVREIATRALWAGVGLAAPPAILVGASWAAGGTLLQQFITFSRTVTQGDFTEGGRLPFAFLWHAEHLLLVLWLAALGLSVYQLVTGDRSRSLVVGVAGALGIYGALFVGSVVLKEFVVYGRLVRQAVPFLCLVAAHHLERRRHAAGAWRLAFPILMLFIALQAAQSFHGPLVQEFPAEFRRRAEPIMARWTTEKTRLLFAHHIYPAPVTPPLPPHTVLLRAPHPLEFLPYQYEGYTPEERSALRNNEISMRLILLD
jgi:hypothetical protein